MCNWCDKSHLKTRLCKNCQFRGVCAFHNLSGMSTLKKTIGQIQLRWHLRCIKSKNRKREDAINHKLIIAACEKYLNKSDEWMLDMAGGMAIDVFRQHSKRSYAEYTKYRSSVNAYGVDSNYW